MSAEIDKALLLVLLYHFIDALD